MLEWLARRFGRYAIPKLGLLIVAAQGITWLIASQESAGGATVTSMLELDLAKVRAGEWWRLLSFVVLPPTTNAIFLLCALYFFWLMSNALEAKWGSFRFNCYLAVGWLVTLAAGVATAAVVGDLHAQPAQNGWMMGSVFLAFAWLWPDFVIMLFLIIPVKVKYLAAVTWACYLWTLCVGSWGERALVVAAIANFLLFFSGQIVQRMRRGHRQMVEKVVQIRDADQAFHTCVVCGATEKTQPDAQFRTCGECRPAREFCLAHLKGHEHLGAATPVDAAS
ncbi:MAG: hypothetical protein H0W83_16175 [Planctomycetes bacterium]|nr:hypothetical protein [Planctomycetota bacterium]